MPATTERSVSFTEVRPGIVLVTIDMPGSSANILTTDLFAELDETFAALQKRTDLNGLILKSAKPTIFVAGADLKRIAATLDWPDEKIIQFCTDGRAVMSRLSRMPFVSVAAIHGACVGGGLELTLWCDHRVATDDRKTVLGLPEVKLGLVPGWAGTVRLPRIANLEVGIDLVTSARLVNAREAAEMGFVDRVSSIDNLIEDAIHLVEQELENPLFEQRRRNILGAVSDIQSEDIEQLKTACLGRIRSCESIHHFAPEVVLEHMLATAGLSHERACASESRAMARVYGSDPSYGLLNNFFLGEHNRKNPGFVNIKLADKSFSRIGIVGVGLMGTCIAEICLRQKSDVVLLDASRDALRAATARLKDVPSEQEIHVAGDYAELAGCDLVIESVVETAEIKKSVLRKVESAVDPHTIIATNTSAIPLARLALAVEDPRRFCGIHFCHPHLMQLVEVVKGEHASPATMANVTRWIRQIRKMPVVVNDCAGFVVNRLLAAMLDQTIRLYSWGYGIREIDQAMRGFGFRGGPFEIVDVIGADVCMYAGREMWDSGVKCVTLSPVLPRMVKKGWLGRKTGRGFYRYEQLDGERIWDGEIDLLLESYVDVSKRPEFEADQIAESICAVITLEAARILDDEIAADPRDIDLCIINGFSFPAHVGGILFWADRLGVQQVNDMLLRLATCDEKLLPTDRLKNMQVESIKFYAN